MTTTTTQPIPAGGLGNSEAKMLPHEHILTVVKDGAVMFTHVFPSQHLAEHSQEKLQHQLTLADVSVSQGVAKSVWRVGDVYYGSNQTHLAMWVYGAYAVLFTLGEDGKPVFEPAYALIDPHQSDSDWTNPTPDEQDFETFEEAFSALHVEMLRVLSR